MLRKTLDQFPLARPYLIVSLISLGLFWPSWQRLFSEWIKWEQVLTHGLPTFLIFLGLLLMHPPHPGPTDKNRSFSLIGGAALLVLVVFWTLLELVRLDTLTYLILPAGLLAIAWTLLGLSASFRFLPYVLLFGLSLPIWADLVPLLVRLATVVVSELVSAMGITALIEGANITLPYGRLIIADGCSGIRYFAISILLAMIIAILNDYRWQGWCIAVGTAMALGLAANWVRITALVYIAYDSNMESSLVTDHETFGWLVFGAFVIPALLLAPAHHRQASIPLYPPRFNRFPMIFVAISFLIGPLGLSIAHSAANGLQPWQLVDTNYTPAEADKLPIAVNLPGHLNHDVWRGPDGSWISLAQSPRQDKLVPYLPRPLETRNWFLAERLEAQQIQIYQHLTRQQKVAVLQRYLVGSYQADSYRTAKLLQIPATLRGQDLFALVTIEIACTPRDCEQAVARLERLSPLSILEHGQLAPRESPQ